MSSVSPHDPPLAAPLTGAALLVAALKDLGVTVVFGYTGAAILPVFDELAQAGIRIVVSANEQSAAFAAAGYSRAGGGVGVAIVTSGPAITNTLTAVADAYADSVPLLVIAGQVPEYKLGTDSFQHIDVSRVFGATAKRAVLVENAAEIEALVKDAFHFAAEGKAGPVVLDFPLNLQQEVVAARPAFQADFARVYADETHLSDDQCARFFALLSASQRPLLYLGGGLNSERGSRAIRRFNRRFVIPSVNTLMAKGVVDETDPLSLGLLGMFGTPYANMIIQENDFFFAIGVRWDDRVAEKVGFAIHSRIATIDINPAKVHQIRSERNPDFSVIGDAPTLLDDLSAYAVRNDIILKIAPWQERAAGLKRAWPLDYRRDTTVIQQAEVLDLLNTLLPANALITTGVGNHQLLAAQYLRMRVPRRFLTSGSFGTMGFGMPSAVGAHFAVPDASVIVIDGDSSLRMNLGELTTIGTLGLPIKILLLNNQGDGMVYNLEDAAYGGRHSATRRPRDVDFSAVARLSGFSSFAERITERGALRSSLEAFLAANGPAMLEVMTDIEEAIYPIVPSGKGYHDMNLGPYIHEVEGASATSVGAKKVAP